MHAVREGLPKRGEVHQYNLRDTTLYDLPAHRLSQFEKKPTYIGRKLHNHLPSELRDKGENELKPALHKWLADRPFYSIEEFFQRKSEEKKIKNELMTKVQRLDALELQLLEVTDSEHKAYEQFCKMEKTQRVKVDTLLATVLHHQEMWTHQIALSDDMKTRILHLIDCLKQGNKPRKSRAEIPVERSLNVKSIVTRISSEIRISISDIEHKQNQISHLETDLSKVRVVLETVQQEIDDMIKETNSKDLSKKVPCLLKKLKKQITNTLTKAGSLVSVYQAAKKEYAGTAQQVVQLQREFDSLEEEVHSSYYYICQVSWQDDRSQH
ncbi:hypothetical protein J6590_033919 [Homalodisca vitripennis]|nr:hypothetical protein J6590_033919 [Homalodisca vitripennis]